MGSDRIKISVLEMEDWKINLQVVSSQLLIFSFRFWVWLDWMKKPAVSMKTSVRDLYRRLMAQEARFLACLWDIGKPGDYLLTLCCFPFHLKNLVQEGLSSTYRVCCQGEENSLKPLCREDQAFVSLSEAFIVVQKVQFENFFLKLVSNIKI